MDFNGKAHSSLRVTGTDSTGKFIIKADDSGAIRKFYVIRGSANLSGFQYYKLEYGKLEGAASIPQTWYPVSMPMQSGTTVSTRAVNNGILGLFDVTDLSEGRYRLLLTVIGKDKNGVDIVKQTMSEILLYNDPLFISGVLFSPTVNNGEVLLDPDKDALTVSFALNEKTAPGGVHLIMRNFDTGVVVRTVQQSGLFGANIYSWDGKDGSGARVPDGKYYLEIKAYDVGSGIPAVYYSTNASVLINVKNTPLIVSSLEISPPAILPSGVINKASIQYVLSKQTEADQKIYLSILHNNTTLIRVLNGNGIQGINQAVWDGKDLAGNIVQPGTYGVLLECVGVTNLRLSNCITVESPANVDFVATLDDPSQDGTGRVQGQSGNFLKWEAFLKGQKSTNQIAQVAFSSLGIKNKRIDFQYLINLAMKKSIDTFTTNCMFMDHSEDNHNIDTSSHFDITHNQNLILSVRFKGSDDRQLFEGNDLSRFYFHIYTNTSQAVKRFTAWKRCGNHNLNYTESFQIGTSASTTTTTDLYGFSPIFTPGHYPTTLATRDLSRYDFCYIALSYVTRTHADSDYYYPITNSMSLVYCPDSFDSGVWKFEINGVVTNEVGFTIPLPTITNVSYNAQFCSKTIAKYIPYDFRSLVSYPSIVSDILLDKISVAGVNRDGLLASACGQNTNHQTVISTKDVIISRPPFGWYQDLLNSGSIQFKISTDHITRSAEDYYWNPSGRYFAYVNAFSPISNSLANTFSNIHAIPSHVYVHWIKMSNANPGDGLTPQFLFNGGGMLQTTTNTNDCFVITSKNIVEWSTKDIPGLDSGVLSGTTVLPFEENAIYPINFFTDNSKRVNPEKNKNDLTGSKTSEIRVETLNLVLRKGDKIVAFISNNILLTNNADIQIVDKDTRAPLAEGTNLQRYCQAKGIHQNDFLESIYVRNNKEIASLYVPIKGMVSSGSNYVPLSYTLKWGQGENPVQWTEFATGVNNESGVLGYWDVTGKHGTYSILLTVSATNGQVKQAKRIYRLGGTISEDQVTLVSSPYGTTTLAFPAGSIFDGDEVYIKDLAGNPVDIVVYGKFDQNQVPGNSFTGSWFSQADLVGTISMRRFCLGGEGSQAAGPGSEDLRSAFGLNASFSNLDPGSFSTQAPSMANNLLINGFYFKTDYDQYIEIYNPTQSDIDLSQYIIGDGEGEGRFPQGSIIKATNFIVIARNAERYKERFPGKRIDFEWDPLQYSGTDDAQVPNLLAVSDLKPAYNIELNSSATRGVSLIPVVHPEVYQNINNNQIVMGPVFDFKPDGLQFNTEMPPTLTYRGKLDGLNGQDPATLGIYYINDQNKIELLPSSRITLYDSDNDGSNDSFLITAMVEHFSHYVLLSDAGSIQKPVLDTMPMTYNRNGIRISGKAAYGDTVVMQVNGTTWGKIKVAVDGTFTFDNVLLKNGKNSISAYAMDVRDGKSDSAILTGVILDTTLPALLYADQGNAGFSPNGDGCKDSGYLSFVVTEPVTVTLNIFNNDGILVHTKISEISAASNTNIIYWDGKNSKGVIQPEGMYRYRLDVVDKAGNLANDSTGVTGFFTIDLTPPEVVIQNTINKYFSPNRDGVKESVKVILNLQDKLSKNVFFSARIVDRNSGALVRLLHSAVDIPIGSMSVIWDGVNLFNSISGDGEYQVQIICSDSAGNTAPIMSSSVIIDTVAPSGFKNLHLSKNKLKAGEMLTACADLTEPLKMQIAVIDQSRRAIKTIFSNDCIISNYSAGWNNPLLEDGDYTVQYSFQDDAGNTAFANLPFLKDSMKPVIELPDMVNSIYGGLVSFTGSILDANLDRYTVFIREEGNATNWVAIYSSGRCVSNDVVFNYNSGINNGLFSFRIDASDVVGNTNSHLINAVSITNSTNKVFYYQTTKVISSSNVYIPYFLLREADVQVAVSSASNNVCIIVPCPWEAKSPGLALFNWTATNTNGAMCSDGRYFIDFVARDTNGHIMEQVSIPTIIDRQSPTVAIHAPEQARTYSDQVKIYASVSDQNLAWYKLYIAKGGLIPDWVLLKEGQLSVSSNLITTFNAQGLDGDYSLRLVALDKAFNRSETITTFKVDSKPLYLTIDTPTTLDLHSGTIDVVGSVAGLGLKQYTLLISNNNRIFATTNSNQVINNVLGSLDTTFCNDGTALITLKAEKESGKIFETHVSIIIDNTAPDVSINSNLTIQHTNGFVSVWGSVSDTHLASYILYTRLTGEANWTVTCRSAACASVPVELYSWDANGISGMAEIRLVATDRAGNEAQSSMSINLKKLEPQALITSPLAMESVKGNFQVTGITFSPYLQSSTLILQNELGEAVFVTNVQANPSSGQFSAIISRQTNMKDGEYSIVLEVVDTSGRKACASRRILIDNAIPRFENVVAYPQYFNPANGVNNGTTVSFNLTEDCILTAYVVTTDQVKVATIKNEVRFQRGSHYIVWDGKDALDNVVSGTEYIVHLSGRDESGNSTQTNVTVRIDNQPPQTSANFTGACIEKGNTKIYGPSMSVNLDAVDLRSGVWMTIYSFNNSSQAKYQGPICLSNSGEFKLNYFSIDKLGNQEALHTTTFIVDADPPVISYQVLGQMTNIHGYCLISSNSRIVVQSTSEEAGNQSGLDRMEYKLVGKGIDKTDVQWVLYTQPISIQQEGEYRLYIRAFDRLGNTSEYSVNGAPSFVALRVDNTYPVISDISINPDPVAFFVGSTNTATMSYSLNESSTVNSAVFDFGTNRYALNWNLKGQGYKLTYPEQKFSWTCTGTGRKTQALQKAIPLGQYLDLGIIKGDVSILLVYSGSVIFSIYTNNVTLFSTLYQNSVYGRTDLIANVNAFASAKCSAQLISSGFFSSALKFNAVMDGYINSGWREVPKANGRTNVSFIARNGLEFRYSNLNKPPIFLQMKTNGVIVFSGYTNLYSQQLFFQNDTAVDITTQNVSTDPSVKGVEYICTYRNEAAFYTQTWSGQNGAITAGMPVKLSSVDLSAYYQPSYTYSTDNPNVVLFVSNNDLYARTTMIQTQPWSQDMTPQDARIEGIVPGADIILDTAASGNSIPADVVVTNWIFTASFGNITFQPMIQASNTNALVNRLPVYKVHAAAIAVKQLQLHQRADIGFNTTSWDGVMANGQSAAPGKYHFGVQASSLLNAVSPLALKEFFIVRDITPPVVSLLSNDPPVFSPNNDSISDTTAIRYTVSDDCSRNLFLNVCIVDASGAIVSSNQDWTSTDKATNVFTWQGTSSDGQYYIHIRAKDEVGNISTPLAVKSCVDLTPPVTSHNYTLGSVWINSNVIVNFAAVDPVVSAVSSGIWQTVVGLNGAMSTNVSAIPVTDEGMNVLTFYSLDIAGNRESAREIVVSIDKTPPVVSITGVTNGGWYRNTVSPAISIIEPNLKAVSSLLNSSNYSSGTSIVAEGAYTLRVLAEDKAGNSAIKTVDFSIDKTAPLTSVNLSGEVWSSTNVTVQLAALDPVSAGVASGIDHVVTSINGRVSTNCTVLVISNDGQNMITYYAVDKAGNIEDVKFIRIMIDRSKPEISFSGFAEGGWYNRPVLPVIAISDLNLATSNMLLNNVAYSSGTAVSNEGKYQLLAKAADKAGNAVEKTATFFIDKTSPVSIINQTNETWHKTAVNVQLVVSDPLSGGVASGVLGYLVSLSGAMTAVYSNTDTIILNIDGDYSLTYQAFDKAGNVEVTNRLNLHLDTVAPVIRFTGFTNGTLYNALGVVPGMQVTEKALKTNYLMISKDGADFTYLPIGTRIAGNGSYAIRGTAEDRAGNRATIEAAFSIDAIAPAVPAGLTALSIESNVLLNWLAVSDPDLAGYRIYVDGILASEALVTNIHYFYTNNITQHGFQISAVDTVGNESARSPSVTVPLAGEVVFTAPADSGTYCDTLLIRNTWTGNGRQSFTLQIAPYPVTEVIPDKWVLLKEHEHYQGHSVTTPVQTKKYADGRYLLKAVIKDMFGTEYYSTRSISFDNTPPVTMMVVNGTSLSNQHDKNKYYYTNTIAVGFTAIDPVNGSVTSGIRNTQYQMSGHRCHGWKSWPTNNAPLLISEEGEYRFRYRSADNARENGNVENTQEAVLVFDKTCPEIRIFDVAEGGVYAHAVRPKVQFQDRNLDADRTFIQLNGTPYANASVITANGNHLLRAVAQDLAGHRSEKIVRFSIDTIAPAVTISGITNDQVYSTPVAPVIGIVESDPKTTTILLNGKPFVSGTMITEDGKYVLLVLAIDVAGNSTKREIRFSVDQSAPRISVTGVANDCFYNHCVTALISISENNIKRQTITLNGMPYRSGTKIAEDGVWNLAVQIEDMLGRSTATNLTFVIDTKAPEVKVSAVADGSYYRSTVIPIIKVEDANPETTTITVNGNPYTAGTGITEDGQYVLKITASDKAKNKTEKTVVFTVDQTPPEIFFWGANNGGYYNNDVHLSFQVRDLNLEKSIISHNGRCLGSITNITFTEEGKHSVEVEARDKSENFVNSTISFVIDRTKPVITVSGVTNAGVYREARPCVTIVDSALNTNQCSIKLNGQNFTSGTLLTNFGEYTLTIRGVDLAGNLSEMTTSFTVKERDINELLLFYASYDASVHADYSQGDKKNHQPLSALTEHGYHHSGLHASPLQGLGVVYKAKDNFSPERGTICVWVRNNWTTANYFGRDQGRWIFNIYKNESFDDHGGYMGLAVFKDRGTVFTVHTNREHVIELAVDKDGESTRWYAAMEWVHVAVAYDMSIGKIATFINGVMLDELIVNPWSARDVQWLRIGARNVIDVEGAFYGLIDELRIYNEPLSQKQIESVYKMFKSDSGSY